MILIPARNEAPRVGRVVRDVREACPGIPVVVVVNGCTDETAAVAIDAGARVIESAPAARRRARARRCGRWQSLGSRGFGGGVAAASALDHSGDGRRDPMDVRPLH